MSTESTEQTIRIRVGDREENAAVLVPASYDPAVVTTEALVELARQRGVMIDEATEAKLAAIADSFRQQPRDIDEVFAIAIDPTPGEDARLEWQSGFDPKGDPDGEPEADKGRSNDRVDFYNASHFIQVKSGDQIAKVIPATDGHEGRTVTGKVLAARRGASLKIAFEEDSITVESSGKVVSKIDGILQLVGGKARVTQSLDISGDVDFSTGNIHVDGSVHVHQGVCDQFEVRAAESIIVDGLVGESKLQCGGDLLLRRGMAARKSDQAGFIKVGGDAEVGFLDNVKGSVQGDLAVRRELVTSNLVIGGDLDGSNATVLGGVIAITGSAVVKVLGSDGYVATRVILGSVPLLMAEMRTLRQKVQDIEKVIDKGKAEYELLSQPGRNLSPAQKERLTEFHFILGDQEEQKQAAATRLAEIDEIIDRTRKVDLRVLQIVYPGVDLVVGEDVVSFREPIKGPVHFTWDDHRRLTVLRSDGSAKPINHVARVTRRAA